MSDETMEADAAKWRAFREGVRTVMMSTDQDGLEVNVISRNFDIIYLLHGGI